MQWVAKDAPVCYVQDPAWVQACADRFAALRAGPWSDNAVTGQLSEVQQQLAPAAERTLTRQAAPLFFEIMLSPGKFVEYALMDASRTTRGTPVLGTLADTLTELLRASERKKPQFNRNWAKYLYR